MVLVADLSESIRVGLLVCRAGAARISDVVSEYAWAVPRVLRALRWTMEISRVIVLTLLAHSELLRSVAAVCAALRSNGSTVVRDLWWSCGESS